MLFHVSSKAGLKILKPHISTHKKAYVYAVEDMVTGMLFGTKKDDFDFMITTDGENVPIVYECYPGAFQSVYEGKSCSVYQVEENGFQRGMTSWSAELVCENDVEVREETVIEDLYRRLLDEEQKGSLRIHRYEYCEEYRKKIAAHIVDRLVRFEIDLDRCLEWEDERFSAYYEGVVRELRSIMDGHLLR